MARVPLLSQHFDARGSFNRAAHPARHERCDRAARNARADRWHRNAAHRRERGGARRQPRGRSDRRGRRRQWPFRQAESGAPFRVGQNRCECADHCPPAVARHRRAATRRAVHADARPLHRRAARERSDVMDGHGKDLRIPALRRFAVAITALNIAGQTFLGFEQAWAHLVVSVLTAYATELAIETIDAWATRRTPRYAGGNVKLLDFLLSPHITGCAVAMLLYANGRLLPIAFASATAIASKTLFRVRPPAPATPRHFLNPSNFGITATLLLFPWVSIAPPYQFTENLGPAGSLILPALLCVSGSLINARFTGRLPLILSWMTGFVLQAAARSVVTGAPLAGALNPMTGVAFLLFSFYMVSDP